MIFKSISTLMHSDGQHFIFFKHIARFKKPKRYVFVDSLPKNNYGKVLKTELRERLRNEGARA